MLRVVSWFLNNGELETSLRESIYTTAISKRYKSGLFSLRTSIPSKTPINLLSLSTSKHRENGNASRVLFPRSVSSGVSVSQGQLPSVPES